MADLPISQLTAVTTVTGNDNFVLEQNHKAMRLTGQLLLNWLLHEMDAHGGIRSIEKTGTVGLVDTYTITLSDETTTTFTVTNGEKGDNAYTWIKYSTERPIKDSDMHDTIDNWIGICIGYSNVAPSSYTSYQWFKIKGEKGAKGNKGDNPIVTTNVSYGKSTSQSTMPTTWSSTIPSVPQGNFLWTKVELSYSTGGSSVFYSQARMGIDGEGSVSSVNGISPDANQNVDLLSVEGKILVIRRSE